MAAPRRRTLIEILDGHERSIRRLSQTLARIGASGGSFLPTTGGTMSGAILLAVGTEALPSLSFTGDPDTGLYWASANNPALSAGNLRIMDWHNNGGVGQARLGAGTEAKPSLTFIADPNTGLYWVSLDVLGWTAGGNLGLSLGSTGSMELHGTGNQFVIYSRDNDDQSVLLYNPTGSELHTWIGGTKLKVTSTYVAMGGDHAYGLGSIATGGGTYGTVNTVGTGSNSYEGYSINGDFVFMSNSSTQVGIYDDTANQWLWHTDGSVMRMSHNNGEYIWQSSENTWVRFYYNGVVVMTSTSGGINTAVIQLTNEIQGAGGAVTDPTYTFTSWGDSGMYGNATYTYMVEGGSAVIAGNGSSEVYISGFATGNNTNLSASGTQVFSNTSNLHKKKNLRDEPWISDIIPLLNAQSFEWRDEYNADDNRYLRSIAEWVHDAALDVAPSERDAEMFIHRDPETGEMNDIRDDAILWSLIEYTKSLEKRLAVLEGA